DGVNVGAMRSLFEKVRRDDSIVWKVVFIVTVEILSLSFDTQPCIARVVCREIFKRQKAPWVRLTILAVLLIELSCKGQPGQRWEVACRDWGVREEETFVIRLQGIQCARTAVCEVG